MTVIPDEASFIAGRLGKELEVDVARTSWLTVVVLTCLRIGVIQRRRGVNTLNGGVLNCTIFLGVLGVPP